MYRKMLQWRMVAWYSKRLKRVSWRKFSRDRSDLKLSWVAIVSIVISRLPIINTRAFSVIILSVIPSHVSPRSQMNLPHALPRSLYPFVTSFCTYHKNFSRHRRRALRGRFRRASWFPTIPYLASLVLAGEVCESPLPRGANYIVRNVNLVCQAVSAREGSLTSLDGTCTSLAITVPRDEEISSYSWEHPTALSALSTNTRNIRV